jgi:hypothetical protein
MTIRTAPIGLYPTPGGSNTGIVPPWLAKPPVIVPPVMPERKGATHG